MFQSSTGAVNLRRTLVVSASFAMAIVAVTVVFAAVRDRLPDPLATHFEADGGADGFSGTGGFLGTALGVLTATGTLFSVLTHLTGTAPALQRALTATGCAVAALLATAFAVTLRANADTASGDAAAVTLPTSQLLLALAAAAVGGGLSWLLAGPGVPVPAVRRGPSATAPRLELAVGETAVWTRTAGSPAILLTAAALAVAGAVTACTADWGTGIGLLAGAAPLALFTAARVTVDRRGITVTPALLPRPRLTIPLERIEEATSREIDPLRDFSGWGYRARAGASGIILRRGTAISARLAHGSEFVVTVDDAPTAAALLNALAARAQDQQGT